MSNIEVLKSKRFISSLVGMILMLVVSAWPELQPYQEQLTTAITAIIMALIAGFSLTDAVKLIWGNLPKIVDVAEDLGQIMLEGQKDSK